MCVCVRLCSGVESVVAYVSLCVLPAYGDTYVMNIIESGRAVEGDSGGTSAVIVSLSAWHAVAPGSILA